MQNKCFPQRRRITPGHAFLLGALVALCALSPAILPYGGRYVTRGDFIEQQLPFILETRRILRAGLDSYSFNTLLGTPAVGSYAFYTLGSPFVWPLVLLPEALIPFGISVMAVLKHAVCALCAFLVFRINVGNGNPCGLMHTDAIVTLSDTGDRLTGRLKRSLHLWRLHEFIQPSHVQFEFLNRHIAPP